MSGGWIVLVLSNEEASLRIRLRSLRLGLGTHRFVVVFGDGCAFSSFFGLGQGLGELLTVKPCMLRPNFGVADRLEWV